MVVSLRRFATRFCIDCRGATAIEYAMIAVGISVAIVASLAALSAAVGDKFDLVAGAFN